MERGDRRRQVERTGRKVAGLVVEERTEVRDLLQAVQSLTSCGWLRCGVAGKEGTNYDPVAWSLSPGGTGSTH